MNTTDEFMKEGGPQHALLVTIGIALLDARKGDVSNEQFLEVLEESFASYRLSVINEAIFTLSNEGKFFSHGEEAKLRMRCILGAVQGQAEYRKQIDRMGNIFHAVLGDKWDVSKMKESSK